MELKPSINIGKVAELKKKRFVISNESLKIMRGAEKQLNELQKTIPALKCMTFFGSRTLGTEKKKSDLDSFLLYDGTKYIEEYSKNKGKLDVDRYRKHTLPDYIRSEFDVGYNIENDTVKYDVVDAVDISHEAIDERIDEYNILLEKEKNNPEIKKSGKEWRVTWDLMAPFFLGVGKDLLETRKYILDSLDKRKNGEEIWKEIIETIDLKERKIKTDKRKALPFSIPDYEGYPKTIKDAKKFFLHDKIF